MKHLALAALAASLLGSPAALAADLGGNCCADLEERVAELEATTARKGNRQVSLTISGHVNEAVLAYGGVDGLDTSNARVIPNTASQTRFRLKGRVKVSPQWSAGFLIEVGVGDIAFNPDTGRAEINRDLAVRHSALYITSKALGTVWLGHTSQASDGAAQTDLSRSSVAGYMLTLAPMDSALVGFTVLAFDGGRKNLVKWVSPIVAGFAVSASWSDDDTYDVALRFGKEFNNLRVAGAIAYRSDMGIASGPFVIETPTDTFVVSGSIHEIKSGLFVSGAYGHQDLSGVGVVKGWEGRAGIELKAGGGASVTPFGRYMAIQIDGAEVGRLYGGGIVWSYNVLDVYAAYNMIEIDGSDDINVGFVGAKIRF